MNEGGEQLRRELRELDKATSSLISKTLAETSLEQLELTERAARTTLRMCDELEDGLPEDVSELWRYQETSILEAVEMRRAELGRQDAG